MITVKSTREGLVGKKTATGFVIDRKTPFVALPSVKALYRPVRVTNPRNGKSMVALVLDLGPWCTADDGYVLGGNRPLAESGIDAWGRITNKAGIDLGEAVYNGLELHGNEEVSWEFLDLT